MGKLIAVQGCLIQCKTAGVTVANFQITTPPVTTVLADDKPVYAGTLSVVANGITMGSFTCPTATFTIIPQKLFATVDNQFILLEGDSGLCTCLGTAPNGATASIVFICEISQAGQTSVELDISEGGGDLSGIITLVNDLNGDVIKLTSDLNNTKNELTATKAELNNTKAELNNTKVEYTARIDRIESNLTKEITDRETAVSAESTARTNADTELGNRITDETTARTNADKNLQTQINERRLPPGSFMWYCGIIDDEKGLREPKGFIVCNGQAVSRTTYSALFKAIGTIYGAGDGSTTFNVPNMLDGNGRFIRATETPSNTKQADAIRPINGDFTIGGAEWSTHISNGSFSLSSIPRSQGWFGGHTQQQEGVKVIFKSNTSTSTENRPMNIAFLPLISY